MIGKATDGFWALLNQLPPGVQRSAAQKYALWRVDPFHSSLQFKEVAPGLWSARVNRQYRVLARRRGDLVVWFWIGPHAEYDRLIGGG